ncbi:MAG: flagellar filament outer layer protein FlaA [Spirochaetota bacterium]
MKREVKSILPAMSIGLLILFIGIGSIQLKAQAPATTAPATTTAPAQSAQKQQSGLYEDWMSDFETCEDWRALSTTPLGDSKIRKIPGKPRPMDDQGNVTEFPNEITDENGITHKNENVLGVKGYVIDRGFDRVEVLPPNEFIIRGKAKELKVWALGRKFRHTLFVKFRDYRGKFHKIKVGRLDFWGWREMSVIIPGWIPQSATYAMLDKNLHFVSFFIESDRYEVPGTYYVYLDNFRILTDLSEFTGDTFIKDTW